MERILTEYWLERNEVEDFITYLRERGFNVHYNQNKDSVRYGSHDIYFLDGCMNIVSGSIEDRRKLIVSYKADQLLKLSEEYIKMGK